MMITHRRVSAALAATVLCATPAAAQQQDTLRDQFRLPLPPTYEVGARGYAAPGITIGLPGGFGANFGDLYAGAAYQSVNRVGLRDAGFFAGAGLGDARRFVGVESTVSMFGTWRSCCRGGASFKVHRLLPANASIAAGVENLATWGPHDPNFDAWSSDAPRSWYGSVSKVMYRPAASGDPFRSVTFTLGAGTGRYQTQDDMLEERDGVRPFGAVALRVAEPVSIIAERWSQDWNAGISVVPLRAVPLFITVAVADLATDQRLVAGMAFGTNFTGRY
jgi:hypothetical protein